MRLVPASFCVLILTLACGDVDPASGVDSPLVLVTSEPPGDNCPTGGLKIMVGIDADSDGRLSDDEVTSVSYVCDGGDGARGEAGEPGEQGPPGEDGEPGEQGPTGDDGAPAEDGSDGQQGTPGADGNECLLVPFGRCRDQVLHGIDLSFMDLPGMDFSGSDLRYARMERTDLRYAILRGARLTGALIRRTHLHAADLREVIAVGTTFEDIRGQTFDFRDADLRGSVFTFDESGPSARFEGADLSRADFSLVGSNLGSSTFRDANLHRADLADAYLRGEMLVGADLSFATIRGADVSTADLSTTNLTGAIANAVTHFPADFSTEVLTMIAAGADLSGRDLGFANLKGQWLHNINLDNADLGGADLAFAFIDSSTFIGADLSQANLFAVSIMGTNMAGADFSGADFRGNMDAHVSNSDFTNAVFVGTDMRMRQYSGADFSGSNLTRAWLTGSVFDNTSTVQGADFSQASLLNVDMGAQGTGTAIWSGAYYNDDADLFGVDPSLEGMIDAGDPQAGGSYPYVAVQRRSGDFFDWSNLDLSGADFSNGLFENGDFWWADLSGADFAGTTLINVNLMEADLSGVDFTGAVLNCPLSLSDLSGADLTNADLRGSYGLDRAHLDGVIWSNTICPDGTNSNFTYSQSCLGREVPQR